MARPLRIEYDGAFYHITARGNERKRIYFSKPDYDKFKEYLGEAQNKYGYILYCYVLMTNHFHLLIETPDGNMSKVMHYINGSYTNYVNRRRRRSGHLFQGRYKAVLVDRNSYILELSRYVHLNPVRAGVVSRPEQYPHSSYPSYILQKSEDFIYRGLILDMISSRRDLARKRYREFVERGVEGGLENPLKKIYGGEILGRTPFIREALSRLKMDAIQKEETSHRKELHNAFASDRVLKVVASYFKILPEEVLHNKGVYRNIAIHLMKRWTSISNRQIGEVFGGLSYSAVSKARERLSMRLRAERKLRKEVEQITRILSHV